MTCFYCGGDMVEASTSYVVDSGDNVIVIRKVPCHKCKQCGEDVFNGSVVERLEQITEQIEKTLTEVAIVNYSVA